MFGTLLDFFFRGIEGSVIQPRPGQKRVVTVVEGALNQALRWRIRQRDRLQGMRAPPARKKRILPSHRSLVFFVLAQSLEMSPQVFIVGHA